MAKEIRETDVRDFISVFGCQGSSRLTGVVASQFSRWQKSDRDIVVVQADGKPIEIVERKVLWSSKK